MPGEPHENNGCVWTRKIIKGTTNIIFYVPPRVRDIRSPAMPGEPHENNGRAGTRKIVKGTTNTIFPVPPRVGRMLETESCGATGDHGVRIMALPSTTRQ